MSEGDVSLIRDEDVLRRMWQQTEDFSRKKEIRAHMYKLREERLRNLYSPEPPAKQGKGCEFTSAEGHVKSFADQTFQSMKSKEVRDAGSPPKEFTYRGQDLKELSNAGWNVESENRTTDDGHTHVKSVQATIEGRYDVDGGQGQFAARDHHTQAATEYQDDNTSLKRNESSSNTSAREQVMRQTDDGTHFSSTTSSSTSTSKVQQTSSTKVSNESVPYITSDDYDRQTTNDIYRNEQSITKREATNDYEQSLRRNDSVQGELVSRKIDYPDDNTKIIVETRLLPDGTRMTSTRREFRAPVVHNSRSEQHSQQTRSETKSHKTSTQKKSDTQEFNSKIIHQNVENQRTNIVDSQKTADEYDFKRNQQMRYVHEDDTNTLREQIDRNQHTTDIKEIDKRKVISEDIQKKDKKEHYESFNLNESSSEITSDKRTEEFSERKVTSEQYQTTYNTDYTQKKISNDWSPTHQAWASTLRTDIPISTGPSTRASSPGARTYQSSTSSLRSSVSPDKMTRKPPSRGGSPSKVPTQSPTRTSTDRYSSHSVSETKTTRYTSPESKPPHGKSPTRSNYNPEKSQRTSVSPDRISNESPRKSFTSPDRKISNSPSNDYFRKPENFQRQSLSPDRKNSNNIPSESCPRSTSPSKSQDRNITPNSMRSNQSPTRIQDRYHKAEPETQKLPTRLSPRSSVSPEKKVSGSPTRGLSPTKPIQGRTSTEAQPLVEKHPTEPQLHDVSPTKDYASSHVQHRPSPSPERKPNHQPNKNISDIHSNVNPRQSSSSPERKPGYMRPTAASQHPNSDNLKTIPKKPSASPDRKALSTNVTQKEISDEVTKIKNEHYTFIDEETKMYSRTNRDNVEVHTKTSHISDIYKRKSSKSPSPMRSSPSMDSPDYCQREPTPRPPLIKKSRSPSPPKGPVTFTEHTSNTMKTDKVKTIQTDVHDHISNIKDINSLQDNQISVKYDTYDKKQRVTSTDNETKIATSEINYDSLAHRDKSPKKISESPSTTRKSPRQSISPVKPIGKDTHIKTTTDFITTEKTTEEFNKKMISKDRPRQLVTPSTSPTRKPKTDDTAPSTGQSSPTTSVSGFVYFGSPRAEKSIVTDLDEQESYTETTDLVNTNIIQGRPKNLDVKRSPSPSKIPCRSPSPEKNISPTKENLPRKSSLKKPSANNQVSPIEKPPSNFRVSPTMENRDQAEHIIVKKDRPDKEDVDKTNKSKPPLERRETYEERCRKILGMMDEDKNKTISKNNEEPTSSPSVSPTYNPTDEKCFDYNHQITTTKAQSSTNDIIKSEKEITDYQNESHHVTKYSSRDNSPTKLQDIISTNLYKKSDTTYDTKSQREEITSLKTKENEEKHITHRKSVEKTLPFDKVTRSSISPDKKVGKEPSKGQTFDKKTEQFENNKYTNSISPSRAQPKQSFSPDRKLKPQKLYTTNEELAPEKNTVNIKSSTVIRQETYDVDESQLLSDSNLPHEPKCISTPTTNKRSPSRVNEERTPTRSPSPKKTITSVIENTEDLIVSEREKEILDRVQQSLRKLSPNRKEKSPSHGKSPSKTMTQDREILTNEYVDRSEVITQSEKNTESVTNIEETKRNQTKHKQTKEPNDGKTTSKLPSRNTSPVKKTSTPGPTTSPESPNKSRSISPKKPISSVERPLSPQIQKTSGIKPREPVSNYSTKKTISPTKTEKNIITIDGKKTITKQNSFTTKTLTTSSKMNQTAPNKTNELEPKRAIHKNQQNVLKKEPDSKVTRTASDTSIKTKKSSPQRMKSKPEIQIHSGSAVKTSKQTITLNRLSKPTITVNQSKLPSKPKSATTLNTSTDDDDVIIDVQQAKSSRENSPDRICPTPINFTDDVGTPRYPDEVNEPDDEFRQRTYNTIHETETIVDDIVEICEDDELFVKRNDNNIISDKDECHLSVTDKVSKFTNKIESMPRTKDTTKHFKDIEKRVHSDFIDENYKSDECLLTVSEKVNKFAKGPRDKDSKSPSRRIVDEYDNNTVYQDDYTKLSVNDKAHLFVETAENVKLPKTKPTSKIERPDLTDVDESLKSDDCLLSVSDKVNKFVKTAEQFLNHSQEINEKEKKIKEQHDIIMKKIIDNVDTDNYDSKEIIDENREKLEEVDHLYRKNYDQHTEKRNSYAKETASSHAKSKDLPSQNLKLTEKTPVMKITTLRSSEAVKKAKALFENIASTQKTIDTTKGKTTKLTDIGVIKKSPKTDSTIVLHPSIEDDSPNVTDIESEIDAGSEKPEQQNLPLNKPSARSYSQPSHDKPRSSPTSLTPHSSETTRTKSPMRRTIETTTSKTVSVSQPVQRAESPYVTRTEHEKSSHDKVPSYQRPTKTSQMKEETKTIEESEVSSRRGSGKFGVELRRTSVERSTTSSERRRSIEHHQPCIEDIFDLDLLEQMLEKVVGYEQRRRIRAQMRIAKKRMESDMETHTKTTKHITISKSKSPDRRQPKSPERQPQLPSQETLSPDRQAKQTPQRTSLDRSQPKNQSSMVNGQAKDLVKIEHEPRHRPRSPGHLPKVHPMSKSPVRQPSPDKKTRMSSPSKTPVIKPKTNRFNEYATAYLKKAGVNETDKVKVLDTKVKKTTESGDRKTVRHLHEEKVTETKSTISKSYTERTSSKDTIEVTRVNGKRTPSPEKKRSPERRMETPTERQREKSPSPVKRQLSDFDKKESPTKTVHQIDKKLQPKRTPEEKPSWVTNRNLKKITSETRTFSNKKIENEKPKYRAPSPSKVIAKPIDVITSSYGPGPLDADGKPLFGIKALRNGATNYQVKGTVVRQEFHSRNGGEPEGSVSVTAYSSSPEELERLLQCQGERPSRLHGLAAITTTKKFGGTTGNSYKDIHTKEERAALDQFTHSDRRVVDNRVEISDVTSSDKREERLQEIQYEESTGEDKVRRERPIQDERREWADKRERTERTEKMEKTERSERREDKKTVRQSSVKSLTEKYIKNASEAPKPSSAYPKAGLILRTANMKDSVSSDSSVHAGLARTDSEHSLGSVEEVMVTSSTDRAGRTSTSTDRAGRTTTQTDRAGRTTTQTDRAGRPVTHVERSGRTTVTTTTTSSRSRAPASFLDSSTKVTGVQDILTRMKNADIVIQEGDSSEDSEARALLNKFLGATVLMAGMQGYVTEGATGKLQIKETVRSSSGKVTSSVEELDLDQCWDERTLRKLLDECTDTEQRRRLRARIRSLMAEQEACATAVTEALAAAGEVTESGDGDARGESLLLPLLQGLLGGGGERLLAGLGSAGADVVADVRRSLARLRAALAPPTDHPQARALLALADRLEDALAAADRLDGCRRRPRRRSRAARHTVGVTHEELAEARRLVDRDQLALDAEPPVTLPEAASGASTASVEETPTPERKQSVDDEVSFHDAVASRQKSAPIAHSASFVDAKVNRDARVVERRAPAPRKPDFYRHSIADASRAEPLDAQRQPEAHLQYSQPRPEPPSPRLAHPPPPQPQPFRPQREPEPPYRPQPQPQPPPTYRRPSDAKSGIAKIANKFDNQAKEIAPSFPRRAPFERRRSPPPVSAPTISMKPLSREEPKRAPLYKPLPPTYNFAAPPPAEDFSKPLNRFGNNKRARMKRANTIDIGKPLGGYRMDSDTDEDSRGPAVPKFQPQTENDKKFVAFMRKNEENQVNVNGQTNWNSRFGNIKNAFESREREDNSRPSSGSSARRFWRTAEESPPPSAYRPQKFLNDVGNSNVKPPWVAERRDSRSHVAPQVQIPPPADILPASHPPPVPQSPTRPIVVKPFVAKPIPVNQFSHAPMSAFKPPAKISSPTSAPTHIWSPPSLSNTVSPTTEAPQPMYGVVPKSIASPPIQNTPWTASTNEKPRKVISKFDVPPPPVYKERQLPILPTPPTHAPPQIPNYAVKAIPSQNNLTAPKLVKKIDDAKPHEATMPYIPKVDAQQLQIEFYEKQIRERGRIEPMTNGHPDYIESPQRKPPAPPGYTVTDYTPNNVVSTFVPLQQTPDIEKARAHKVDYLPDVVQNEGDRNDFSRSPVVQSYQQPGQRPRGNPYTSDRAPHAHQNGDATLVDDGGLTTEHGSVETRVMRGPVRGAATITAGVRTRNDEYRRGSAADNLKGVLNKMSSPKHEVISQIERKKRENARNQVRAPVQNGVSPLHASPNPRPPPAIEYGSASHSPAGPRSPALAASRESVLSSESAASAGSSPLSRSGSWHQVAERTQKSSSPRKVVARAKSMHLLAVPKLFEGGIAREELTEKKKTVEAYFSGRAVATRSQQQVGGARARVGRSQTQYSLGRSRTMPTVSELQFLDETNADDAFEDLVSALA